MREPATVRRSAKPLRPACGLAVLACLLAPPQAPAHAQAGPYAPAPASPERVAIFDALRQTHAELDRVFVPQHLKVQGDWAFVVADGRSRDGKSRYETENALLHREGRGWTVVDALCGEADCDDARELTRIRAAHPQAPGGIFPAAPRSRR